MRHTVVPVADRDAFRKRASTTRAHYTGAGCRYWIYEEADLPGAYVEFFESSDKDALARAHAGADQPAPRLYVEVDLT
ncbi:MAG TPA: hypothetical protein VF483_07905 [Gemmatimonadaceae bacterium]